MIWARMLAYITGTVEQELLLRNDIWSRRTGFSEHKSKAGCSSRILNKPPWLKLLTVSGGKL